MPIGFLLFTTPKKATCRTELIETLQGQGSLQNHISICWGATRCKPCQPRPRHCACSALCHAGRVAPASASSPCRTWPWLPAYFACVPCKLGHILSQPHLADPAPFPVWSQGGHWSCRKVLGRQRGLQACSGYVSLSCSTVLQAPLTGSGHHFAGREAPSKHLESGEKGSKFLACRIVVGRLSSLCTGG